MWNPFKSLEDKAASGLADVISMFITKIGRMGLRGLAAFLKEFNPERADEYDAAAAAIKK